jgi:hypothetical protein
MARATELIREYTTTAELHTDELRLGQEGWSIESTTDEQANQGRLSRLLARFNPKPPRIVVTYSRQRPS